MGDRRGDLEGGIDLQSLKEARARRRSSSSSKHDDDGIVMRNNNAGYNNNIKDRFFEPVESITT